MAKFFSPQYRNYINSKSWKQGWRRRSCFWLMFGRDTICPLLPAHDAEHLTYRNLTHELPLRDLVPLNRFVHRRLVTPIKNILRVVFGRSLGNALSAWFLRSCILFWWGLPLVLIWRLRLSSGGSF